MMTDTEEKTRTQQATEKITAACKLLKVTLQEDNEHSNWRADVRTEPTPEGLTLYFHCSSTTGWRISVGAGYPRTAAGEYIRPTKYNETPKDRITVSMDKTPEQIARDIEKRLLPVALEYLARVKKQVAENDDYHAKTNAVLEILKGRPLDEYDKKSKEIRLNHLAGYCRAKAHRENIELQLDGLNLETARAILALVPKAKDGE